MHEEPRPLNRSLSATSNLVDTEPTAQPAVDKMSADSIVIQALQFGGSPLAFEPGTLKPLAQETPTEAAAPAPAGKTHVATVLGMTSAPAQAVAVAQPVAEPSHVVGQPLVQTPSLRRPPPIQPRVEAMVTPRVRRCDAPAAATLPPTPQSRAVSQQWVTAEPFNSAPSPGAHPGRGRPRAKRGTKATAVDGAPTAPKRRRSAAAVSAPVDAALRCVRCRVAFPSTDHLAMHMASCGPPASCPCGAQPRSQALLLLHGKRCPHARCQPVVQVAPEPRDGADVPPISIPDHVAFAAEVLDTPSGDLSTDFSGALSGALSGGDEVMADATLAADRASSEELLDVLDGVNDPEAGEFMNLIMALVDE